MASCFSASYESTKYYYFGVFAFTAVLTWILRDYAASPLTHVGPMRSCLSATDVVWHLNLASYGFYHSMLRIVSRHGLRDHATWLHKLSWLAGQLCGEAGGAEDVLRQFYFLCSAFSLPVGCLTKGGPQETHTHWAAATAAHCVVWNPGRHVCGA